jgi:hypothetical protein
LPKFSSNLEKYNQNGNQVLFQLLTEKLGLF